jgi:hypothetical protein
MTGGSADLALALPTGPMRRVRQSQKKRLPHLEFVLALLAHSAEWENVGLRPR